MIERSSPSTSVLLDLAERCEKATGPDRELDARIALFCGVGNQRKDMLTAYGEAVAVAKLIEVSNYVDVCLECERHGPPVVSLAPYTASIDAAMSLVPEGDPWTLGQNIHHRYWLANVNEFGPDQKIRSRGQGNSNHAPALALCAAALRARSPDVQGK